MLHPLFLLAIGWKPIGRILLVKLKYLRDLIGVKELRGSKLLICHSRDKKNKIIKPI